MRRPEHFEQRHIPDDDENREQTRTHASDIDIQIYNTHRIYDISNLQEYINYFLFFSKIAKSLIFGFLRISLSKISSASLSFVYIFLSLSIIP